MKSVVEYLTSIDNFIFVAETCCLKQLQSWFLLFKLDN